MKSFSAESIGYTPEAEPKYRFMVTRHAERLPDGSLSPEGVENSKKKGERLKDEAEVIKGYASDEKTKRTVQTSELISETSETVSPLTGKHYKTREVDDIQYAVLLPDFAALMKKAKKIIDDATVKELGLPEGTVLENLSKDEQNRIAPIRAKNQELGFKSLLESPGGIHRMSMGLANQIVREMKILNRYDDLRKKNKPMEKDVILNTVSHGMFSESLFLEAGFIKTEAGELRKIDKSDFDNSEFGGFITPAESFFLEIRDPNNIPDKIPVSFEKQGRPEEGVVFMDKKKMLELAGEYEKWKKRS